MNVIVLLLHHLIFCYGFHWQISSNIEEVKRSIAEKDSAVRKSEDDAADLKKKVENLHNELEESEREYQVLFSVNFILLNLWIRKRIVQHGCFLT